MPVAFSKHFMAAPTAVSSWYTFSPLSSKVKSVDFGLLGFLIEIEEKNAFI